MNVPCFKFSHFKCSKKSFNSLVISLSLHNMFYNIEMKTWNIQHLSSAGKESLDRQSLRRVIFDKVEKISLSLDNNGDFGFERTVYVLRFLPQPESQCCDTPTMYLANPRHSHITTTGIFIYYWFINHSVNTPYLH